MNAPIPAWAYDAARELLPFRRDATISPVAQCIANHWQRATQGLTCAYCGHLYPPGTPTSQAEQLTAHIRVCDKHPMRALEAENTRLRERLSRFV